MKIIGFSQLHNERDNGNLENWIKCMSSICDEIYVYDQNSTDGSKEIYEKENLRVIYSDTNDFSREISCKKTLLNKLLEENPDADWIFWMDGDTILEKNALNRQNLENFLNHCKAENVDGISLGHFNLWRSKTFYRVDNQYHSLHSGGVVAFWRNNGNLSFDDRVGMHHKQYPDGISKIMRTNLSLIHFGFATDHQIIKKYNNYRSRGQSGWALDRLLDEKTLSVKKLSEDMYPNWLFLKDDVDPRELESISEVYKGNE